MTSADAGGERVRRTQAERNAATRQSLVRAGRQLFGSTPAAEVTGEQLVQRAGVTRGALYHHFGGKEGLFDAVFEQLAEELCAEIVATVDRADSPVEGLLGMVSGYLDMCERPEVRRIALVDAPAVLGWVRWREIEHGLALRVLVEQLDLAVEAGVELVGPTEVVAQLVFSAAVETALIIANSNDPASDRARVEPTLYALAANALARGS